MSSTRLLMASDVHLSSPSPERGMMFCRFLNEVCKKGDHLYLLGDLFDAWIGDELLMQFQELIDTLARTSQRGVAISFLPGNRDFLLGESFFRLTGIEPCAPVIQKQFGRLKIAMLHGDQFCLDDPHYARFYRQVREPKWQHHFLSQSLQKRVQEVEQIRQHTPALYSPEAYAKLYLVPEIFSRLSEIRDADLLVHGHFHLPQQEQVMLSEHPLMRYGLDEWKEKGNYLLIENDSPQWIEFS